MIKAGLLVLRSASWSDDIGSDVDPRIRPIDDATPYPAPLAPVREEKAPFF
jgi:hypothetical protein